MACAYPLMLKNPHYISSVGGFWNPRMIPVACGRCMNCRIDRRNALEDQCNYEYNKFGSGAFVTFTYDENHIMHLARQDKHGNLVFTVSGDDCRKLRMRLKSRVLYLHNEKGVPKNKRFNPDFKMVATLEYGGQYERPHIHCLFFGLDYMFCKKLFQEVWKYGHVDVRPILNGGIRYVLKYLDKQVTGEAAKELYDDNNIERPRMFHSVGLGSGLYLDNLDFIRSHNFCYKVRHNKLRPVPKYWRDKFHGIFDFDWSFISGEMERRGIKYDYEKMNKPCYSIMKMNEFSREKRIMMEQQRVKDSRNHGQAIFSHDDYFDYEKNKYGFDDLVEVDLSQLALDTLNKDVPF